MSRPRLRSSILLAGLAALVCVQMLYRVDIPNIDMRNQFHSDMLTGLADAPYRYRPLTTLLIEAIARFTPVYSFGVFAGSVVVGSVSIFALIFMSYRFFSRYYPIPVALLGVMLLALSFNVTLTMYNQLPHWSLTEAVFFVAAYLAIDNIMVQGQRRHAELWVILLLASLNRETAIFIVAAYGVAWIMLDRSRRGLIWGIVYAVTWVVVFIGLRLALGPALYSWTIQDALWFNGNSGALGILWFVLALGILWLYAWRGFRQAPRVIRALGLIVPPYLLLNAVFGIWVETRLLIPIFPLVIALALAYVNMLDEIALPSDSPSP